MAICFSEFVRRASVAAIALCLCTAAGRALAEEAPIHFVTPQSPAETPSTVIMTDGPQVATEASDAASATGLPETSFVPLDLAALANYAQAAAEEIEGEPMDDASRPFRAITDVTIDAALPAGILPGQAGTAADVEPPFETPEFHDARFWGGWAGTNFQWSATKLCHRPLYFEEVNLERYGYTMSRILQPAISGAHFFLTIPALPYKMVVQPPRECVYTLGYYRAGSPAPWRRHYMDIVWDPTAAAVEGLVVTGLVFLIP